MDVFDIIHSTLHREMIGEGNSVRLDPFTERTTDMAINRRGRRHLIGWLDTLDKVGIAERCRHPLRYNLEYLHQRPPSPARRSFWRNPAPASVRSYAGG